MILKCRTGNFVHDETTRKGQGKMGNDELEPVTDVRVIAAGLAAELRGVAAVLDASPEMAGLADWYDACIRLQDDLDALDRGDAL